MVRRSKLQSWGDSARTVPHKKQGARRNFALPGSREWTIFSELTLDAGTGGEKGSGEAAFKTQEEGNQKWKELRKRSTRQAAQL